MKGDELADLAKGNGADDELVEKLRGIDEAGGPDDVMKEFKGDLGGAA